MRPFDRKPATGLDRGRNELRAHGYSSPAHIIQELLFFTFFFFYIWLIIEPQFIFHGSDRITNFPSFYTTWRFFNSHLSYPGGLVAYVSAFLSQLFCFSWLGALVISLQAWALGRFVAYLSGTKSLGLRRAVRYVPAMLLMVMYGQYTYFFPTTMALLVALALASVYARLAVRSSASASSMSFSVLALLCYYAAGGAVLLLALTCMVRELLSPGRRWLGVPYALVAVAIPYVLGVQLFRTSIINAYYDLLPVSWKVLDFPARRRGVGSVYVLYLLTPIFMLTAGIASQLWMQRAAKRRAGEGERERAARAASVSACRTLLLRRVRSRVFAGSLSTVALMGIGAAVALGSFTRQEKTRLAVDYYAYHRRWPQVLIEGRRACDDPAVMHAVNRALYHTKQLGDRMFAWPQDPSYLFLTDTTHKWVHWQSFATHLEMGAINVAENALMECLAGMGDRPMILKQLALIHLVKANPGTAQLYLHALERTLFHSEWARQYLRLLQRDPTLATDEDIQHLRSIAMDKDYPSLALPKEEMLLSLLEKNDKNRMAFEYLMAWYLSNRQLSRFVGCLGKLRDLGYQGLPKHYEEAILVYAAAERTSVQVSGYSPQEDVLGQISRFVQILHGYNGDAQAARAELAKEHGGTYAFYNIYGPRKTTR